MAHKGSYKSKAAAKVPPQMRGTEQGHMMAQRPMAKHMKQGGKKK